jgi:D-alanyl-lipoteichoic acid acyltransferase DltB (MBOAT superfamily)
MMSLLEIVTPLHYISDALASVIDAERLRAVLTYDPASPLLFNTSLFMLLIVGLLVVYRMLRQGSAARMVCVMLFSLYFYYKSSAECCFILLGVGVSDYILGRLLGAARRSWARRGIVALNVLMNVGMLGYFKYTNLLLSTIAAVQGNPFDALDIILPAGISFFTFRSISYIVDIYRGTIRPETNFLNYLFFITFFPPLLAGPVVRAADMLPQIRRRPTATRAMVGAGLFLIITGLVKKVVIADYISGNFVDRVFDNPSMFTGLENLLAVYGFTLQLYCDFSGYSDMAIGLALLLGYSFKDNFNAPFKSQNPTEWWRRWHISLSTWLRDYLYIPMGGSRCATWRSYLNQFNTMLIGGLWHGASWMYIIWGAWNGLLLVVHKALHKAFKAPEGVSRNQWWRRVANVFITFNLMAFGFMFFRARSLEQVGQMLTQMACNFHASVAYQLVEGYMTVMLVMLMGYLLHFAPSSWTNSLRTRFSALSPVWQAIILAIVVLLIIQVRSSRIVPFIYLQY